MKLYLATANRGKRQELSELIRLEGLGFEPGEPNPYDTLLPVAETGTTFSENALLKANALRQRVGIHGAVLADDSGLCVDFLGGQPGVRSARFAGDGASDGMNCAHLLQLLTNVPTEKRSARFVCVLAFIPAGQPSLPELFEGICPGRIALEPQGGAGFGYDPVFIPEGHDQTFAELGEPFKSRLSHRAKALRAWSHACQNHPPEGAIG